MGILSCKLTLRMNKVNDLGVNKVRHIERDGTKVLIDFIEPNREKKR